MKIIRFAPPLNIPRTKNLQDFSMLVFDVPKLEDEWRRSPFYIRSDEVSPEHAQELQGRLKKNLPIAMPVIGLEYENKQPLLDFYDGRNRTAFLIAQGIRHMPAFVLETQKPAILETGVAREATTEEIMALRKNLPFPQAFSPIRMP
ncbi:MAG: hypothetical protein K2Q01_08720 [Rickettsiales bacterium]|nr:hypothetical protein [Rickettsiales bacterium]